MILNCRCNLPNIRLAHGRRGSTLSAVLIAGSILGAFAVTAVLVGPGSLQAKESSFPPVVEAAHERHQTIIDAIGTIVVGACEVLAVHNRGEGPFAEILLRVTCESDAGAESIALLSHSRILQTITLYTRPADPPISLDEKELTGRSFCDRWRNDPAVQTRVLATGVDEMQLQRADTEGGGELLRIALTWGPESADGQDEASIVVDAPQAAPARSEQ